MQTAVSVSSVSGFSGFFVNRNRVRFSEIPVRFSISGSVCGLPVNATGHFQLCGALHWVENIGLIGANI